MVKKIERIILLVGLFIGNILPLQALNLDNDDDTIVRCPLSLGMKVGITFSSWRGYVDGKSPNGEKQKIKSPVLGNPWPTVLVYGEYAFTNYLGVEIGLGLLGLGDTMANTTTDEKYKIIVNSFVIPVAICTYPLGRAVGSGILKIFAGGAWGYPIGVNHGTPDEELKKCPEEERKCYKYSLLAIGGMSYEWSWGLSLEVQGLLGLTTVMKPDIQQKNMKKGYEYFGCQKVKNYGVGINVGYNLFAGIKRHVYA